MPIINQPQMAILAVGAIEKRPAVVNDALAVQTMAYLTLGFDHRIIDGAVADGFMSHVKHALEHWDPEPGLRSRSAGSAASRMRTRWRCSASWSRNARPAAIGDLLLLVEHPHVLTLGVRGDGGRSHILASADVLAARSVDVFETGRGGDITYHGPGQLVGYPIIDLKPGSPRCPSLRARSRRGADPGGGRLRHRGRACAGADGRLGGGPSKLAAIGVRIARWVTSHGFALNVTTDLDYFNLIVPCGIADRGVTSLAALLGRDGGPRRGRRARGSPLRRGLRITPCR